MHGDVNVRANVAEMMAWLAHALPGSEIVASSETPSGWTRNLTCFSATKKREPIRILWLTDRALEESAPGALKARLNACGLAEVLKRDPSLQVLVRDDGAIPLQEDHSIELDYRQYRVTRFQDHQVAIVDDHGSVLTPNGYRVMPTSVHSWTDDQWRSEIRRFRRG